MGDAGPHCQKMMYTRMNPIPMICPEGQEQEGFLCYDKCENNQEGFHNVCWGQCPKDTFQCGVLCLGYGQTCTTYLQSIGKETL